MYRYVVRRLLISIPVLLFITMLVFLMINMTPGDPVDALIDPSQPYSPEQLRALRENFGLNQPLPVRYLIWLKELAQGNLGYSFQTWRPVSQMVWQAMSNTVLLTALALLLAVIIGIALGVLSAVRQYSGLDYGLTVTAFTAISIPNFFIGLLAIYIFAVKLRWFPAGVLLSITVLATNFVGDGLRDALDPRIVLEGR